jgi:8-oxo-dGTP diphosphatase
VRAYAYQAFYRMPSPLRRAAVILVAPKYLVGAVAVIRDADSGNLLLLRQPSKAGWSLPAGLLKRREEPAVGAARELLEETGVRIDPDDLTPGVPNAIVHPVGVVDTVFFGTVDASRATLHIDGGEIVDIGWFPIDDLPRLTRNTTDLLSRYDLADPARAKADRDPAGPAETNADRDVARPAGANADRGTATVDEEQA